jgi:hypothetical protein
MMKKAENGFILCAPFRLDSTPEGRAGAIFISHDFYCCLRRHFEEHSTRNTLEALYEILC